MRFVVGTWLLALSGQVAVAGATPVYRQVSAPVIRSVRMPPFIVGEGGIRVADGSQLRPHEVAAAVSAPTILPRAAITAQLADFAGLLAAIEGEITPAGVRIAKVAAGSLFATAGLRAGDTIVAVDGKRFASLDDAAELYARAHATTAATVEIIRDAAPITLQLVIR